MPDAWRCECGYTNLGSKVCLVCRRPRQAVPPPVPEPVDEPTPEPAPAPAAAPAAAPSKKPRQRPLKSSAAKKTTARKRAK